MCSVARACVGTVISTRLCQRGGEMEAERARRSLCCPQDVMGAFVVLIQPPRSVATLATNAVSQQMLVVVFFCLELN